MSKIKTSRRSRQAFLKRSNYRKRPLHKRFLLHPASIFMLLLSGLVIGALSFHSLADSYVVTAVVAASPLSQPAIITYPADGAVLTSIPITVLGTCPDGSYVNLTRNSIFTGTALCVNGGFSITTDLFVGANSLQAQDYNITNSPGPSSSPITVYYNPPSSGSSSSSTTTSTPSTGIPVANQSHSIKPFLIETNYLYNGYTPGQTYVIQLQVIGGVAPYALTIYWGDGQASTVAQANSNPFSVSHTYVTVPTSKYYVIKVNAADFSGDSAFIQLVAVSNNKNLAPIAPTCSANSSNCKSFLGIVTEWLWVAWPIWGVLALMTFSFWLGEREEYKHLFGRRSGQRRA